MCIHFGAIKVVHSKNSDKHESSLTLRVTLNKSWHRLIGDTLVVRTLPTVSVYMHASIKWQFLVHDYVNEPLNLFLKLGKAGLP